MRRTRYASRFQRPFLPSAKMPQHFPLASQLRNAKTSLARLTSLPQMPHRAVNGSSAHFATPAYRTSVRSSVLTGV